ncbi:MAG: potassium channel family protein [Acidimicrobiia bacterium]|jgi:hypothetical protein
MSDAPDPATRDRFGLVLVILLATVAVGALSFESRVVASIAVLAEAGALLVIYRVAEVRGRATLVAVVLVAMAVASLVISVWVGPPEFGSGLQSAVGLLIAVTGPWVIVRRLARHRTITIHTVAGALCLYLMIGLAVTYLLVLGQRFVDGPMLLGNVGDPLVLSDAIYFSFITLTTIGFGDITPATGLSRAVAMAGGLIGQIYLVSAVALLVSNIGRPRSGYREAE